MSFLNPDFSDDLKKEQIIITIPNASIYFPAGRGTGSLSGPDQYNLVFTNNSVYGEQVFFPAKGKVNLKFDNRNLSIKIATWTKNSFILIFRKNFFVSFRFRFNNKRLTEVLGLLSKTPLANKIENCIKSGVEPN